MTVDLSNKRVAILSTDGFEQSELLSPMRALRERGATVHVIAPDAGSIRGWNEGDWGDVIDVDVQLGDADPSAYDALVLPGGVMNPDQLRMNEKARAFVKGCADACMPIGAICHGPQILIDCELVAERRLTSYPSLRKDLVNAGARWVDEEVVTDALLTTSRSPADLEAFNAAVIKEIAKQMTADQATG
jgi:protease I